MDYIINGSNSLVPGMPVKLDIMVTPATKKHIAPAGSFSIDNLGKIIAAANWSNLVVEIWGKTDDGENITTPVLIIAPIIPNVPGTISCSLEADFLKYTNFEVRISGVNCSWSPPENVTNITISFYDDESASPDDEIVLQFPVNKVTANPVIKSFSASPTVILAGKDLKLTWVIPTKDCTIVINDGTKNTDVSKVLSGSVTIRNIPAGNYLYTLSVTQGNITVMASVSVRALAQSGFFHVPTARTVVNACVTSDSGALLGVLLEEVAGRATIDCIGYTNEGFSGTWSDILLTDNDKEALNAYILSPMIHLRDVGETVGRLCFIGGSVVNPMKCSNEVAVVDLNKDSASGGRLKIVQCPWPARMGHKCVLFPYRDENMIWLLGGVDENGNALNDVWISGDGKNWRNINAESQINTNTGNPASMPWSPRCYFGSSVQLNKVGKPHALWIGGGFSETEGTETPDVWILKNEPGAKWKQTLNMSDTTKAPFKIYNRQSYYYLSSALSYAYMDSLDATGMYALGGCSSETSKSSYFNDILSPSDGNFLTGDVSTKALKLQTTKNATIIALYFKSCLWYMVLTNEGKDGITSSGLQYWVPPAANHTFIL